MTLLSKKTMALGVFALCGLGGIVAASPTRGPIYDVELIGPEATVYYTEYLVGGEPTRVFLDGDGSTDLDLFVFDERGVLVVKDTRTSGDAFVAFAPHRTGLFRIEVRNLGARSNLYRIDME